MAEIVVLGSLNMDLSVHVPRIPFPGETISGGDLMTSAGGKGANQAAACAKLGAKVAMVGCVGKDEFGTRMTAGLVALGVDVSQVRVDKAAPSGTAMILVDAQGENCIVISGGANINVMILNNGAIEQLIRQAKIILLQLEIPLDVVKDVINFASRYNVPVLLNPAPAIPFPDELYSKIQFLIPNEVEATFLSGIPVNDLASAQAAAQVFLNKGVRTVVITLGEDGAYLATTETVALIPSQKIQPVDTTAAGDSFIGGFAYAQVNHFSLEESVRFACCTGALAATKIGAQASLPTLQEAMVLYRPEGGNV